MTVNIAIEGMIRSSRQQIFNTLRNDWDVLSQFGFTKEPAIESATLFGTDYLPKYDLARIHASSRMALDVRFVSNKVQNTIRSESIVASLVYESGINLSFSDIMLMNGCHDGRWLGIEPVTHVIYLRPTYFAVQNATANAITEETYDAVIKKYNIVLSWLASSYYILYKNVHIIHVDHRTVGSLQLYDQIKKLVIDICLK